MYCTYDIEKEFRENITLLFFYLIMSTSIVSQFNGIMVYNVTVKQKTTECRDSSIFFTSCSKYIRARNKVILDYAVAVFFRKLHVFMTSSNSSCTCFTCFYSFSGVIRIESCFSSALGYENVTSI